jgi:hypothetical protein
MVPLRECVKAFSPVVAFFLFLIFTKPHFLNCFWFFYLSFNYITNLIQVLIKYLALMQSKLMQFISFLLALSLLPLSALAVLDPQQQAEQDIKSEIIGSNSGYDKTVRPTYVTTLYILLFLKQIISIDEKNQVMTSSVNFYVWVNWDSFYTFVIRAYIEKNNFASGKTRGWPGTYQIIT